jgi:energy-coupling factor transport system ATP-binding protein
MTIELDDLIFTYGDTARPALQGLSLRVGAGEVCGVLGRSGAGKSTLCTLLAGFMPEFYHGEASGSALVAGQDVLARSPGELSGQVGLVLSDPTGQISGTRYTVLEEVAFGLENLGVPREEILERAEWALAALGIAKLGDRSPYALSGGQQQRLVLAASLAMRPRVLVLDQPAAQLDPRTVTELAATLRALTQDGTTLLVAEPRGDWLARLADTVLVLHEGRPVLHGPADSVLRDPLLRELNIGWPQATLLAESLRARGHWPVGRELPVRPDELAAGFQEPGTGDRGQTLGDGEPRAGGRGEALLTVDGVSFRYPSGVEALRGVSLGIGRGERVALLGRNGAGKSTLVRQFNGLLRPSAGRVLHAGEDIAGRTVAQCARTVALSFQDVRNQLFSRSVRQELSFGPRNLGYPPERVDALVESVMAATGLAGHAEEHPYDLQPQQRRLVAIGTALAMATPLLVLDEPSAGMDAVGLQTLTELVDARAAAGDSVVLVSHDLDFVIGCTERVLLVADGRLLIDSPWDDLDADELRLLDQEVGLPLRLRLYASTSSTLPDARS